MRVEFEIPGNPRGKQRPRMTRAGHTYTPKETVSYENLVKTCYPGERFPDDAQLHVSITAWYEMPKSISKKRYNAMLRLEEKPTKVPDCDNVGKAVCDALNHIAYRDDAMIVELSVRKYYGVEPKVEVIIFDEGEYE